MERGAVVTLMLFALLLTNLYPWYLIPIFAILALRPDRLGLTYLFAASALGLAYYPPTSTPTSTRAGRSSRSSSSSRRDRAG